MFRQYLVSLSFGILIFISFFIFFLQRDLTGGYYDAGDNIKFGFPMAFTTTLLSWSIIDFGRNMGPELKNAVKAVKWASDYLLKVTAVPGVVFVQVGDAYSDHNCWERPEDMDTLRTVYNIDGSHPGSDVAGETAAALAAASIVFRSRDPGYSRLLLERAVRVRHCHTESFLLLVFSMLSLVLSTIDDRWRNHFTLINLRCWA